VVGGNSAFVDGPFLVVPPFCACISVIVQSNAQGMINRREKRKRFIAELLKMVIGMEQLTRQIRSIAVLSGHATLCACLRGSRWQPPPEHGNWD
jgi:hypothetical protein